MKKTDAIGARSNLVIRDQSFGQILSLTKIIHFGLHIKHWHNRFFLAIFFEKMSTPELNLTMAQGIEILLNNNAYYVLIIA